MADEWKYEMIVDALAGALKDAKEQAAASKARIAELEAKIDDLQSTACEPNHRPEEQEFGRWGPVGPNIEKRKEEGE